MANQRKDDIYNEMVKRHTFGTFLGATMVFNSKTKRYNHLDQDSLYTLVMRTSAIKPRPSISECREVFGMVSSLSPDLDEYKHLILFGDSFATQKVWNMETVEWESTPEKVDHIVWRSAIYPASDTSAAEKFLLEVAKGDKRHARDILQACAPLITATKPIGVIWFSGAGRNGKSGVIRILRDLLGEYTTKMTLHQIEDGKGTPELNGYLGNIVDESSEGYIEDSEKYKVIGEHGFFKVRKFHSQASITVDTAMLHTIFSTNNIPTFADKSRGVRARTIIMPFKATFEEDPLFFKKTFTEPFLQGFLTLLAEEAKAIRDQNYTYIWDETTTAQKSDYDAEVNSMEAYLRFLRSKNCTGFLDWGKLRMAYENWCRDNGETPMGLKAMKTTLKQQADAKTRAVRSPAGVQKRWVIDNPSIDAIKRSELLDTLGLFIDPLQVKAAKEKTQAQQTLLDSEDLL